MKKLLNINIKTILLVLSLIVIVLAAIKDTTLIRSSTFYTTLFKKAPFTTEETEKTKSVVSEESVIIEVVEKSLPSVVTIGISKTSTSPGSIEFDPFNPFAPFRRLPGKEQILEQNIGSGFIISKDGMIITNKHVVRDTEAEYKVLTNDNKEFPVEKIYRDSLNDLAILKVGAKDLKPLELGNSSNLKLGQMAIAIGTPLGEFQNTITTGIVSGLGRGITAGSPFEGFVEKLDNVIQTDAAISPGNSGGPLLNSSGQVIGVNTAIAGEGQNIGFAIPVNVVKDLIKSFNSNGQVFERPYIGVRYQMVDKQTAILNDVVEGAYIAEVIADSPADKSGIEVGDIITKINGKKLDGEDDQALTAALSNKKIGDVIQIELRRNDEIINLTVTLEKGDL